MLMKWFGAISLVVYIQVHMVVTMKEFLPLNVMCRMLLLLKWIEAAASSLYLIIEMQFKIFTCSVLLDGQSVHFVT